MGAYYDCPPNKERMSNNLQWLDVLRDEEENGYIPQKKLYMSVCELMQGNGKRDLKDRIVNVQDRHNSWNEYIDYTRENMAYSIVNGIQSYSYTPTPEQEEVLRKKRTAWWNSNWNANVQPRCVLDCLTFRDCKCHPWYGIVLTENGTEINTDISPIPTEEYVPCIDCFDKAESEYYVSSYSNKSELKRMCKKCIKNKRPLRCMVFGFRHSFKGM